MKRKIINILVVILTIGVIYEISSYFIMKQKSEVLQDIKTVDIFENKDKALSIMIQQSDYTYKEDTSRNAWPSTSEYLYSGAKCTDKEGKDIGDTTSYISFEETNHTATITTKKTIYCTLYFANGRPALEVLKATKDETYAGGGQHTTAVEGLYRFKGDYDKVLNNYICLGADENPDKCKTNTDNMYRIIGVTDGTEESTLGLKAGMLKVIKATPSNTSQAWATDQSANIDWDNGNNTVRTYLNGTFYTGSTIDSRIKPYIAEVNWWKGDRTNATSSGVETKTKTSGKYRVGLMYVGDYYNSWTYAGNTNSWLHITHGLSSSSTYSSTSEWTMTRYGPNDNGNYRAWEVASGPLSYFNVYITFAVRPVFYLASNVGLVGLGSESSPYTITTIK